MECQECASSEQSQFNMSSMEPRRIKANGVFSTRPPSPPHIGCPPAFMKAPNTMTVRPMYGNIDPASLSIDDLAIITRNYAEQVAQDCSSSWTYESRRAAQPILDYLYLGPLSAARDRAWLQSEGITMILVARSAAQARGNFMVVDSVARDLGIEVHYVDVSGYQELIRAFPSALQMINDHMLRFHRNQIVEMTMADSPRGSKVPQYKRGKVLVFCESGNDRSASIVTAYLMSIMGITVEKACQFVNFKRFCICMDEDLKRTLKAYEDILVAQRTVHQQQLSSNLAECARSEKRGIDATLDDDDGNDESMTGVDQFSCLDQDRFLGREPFAPFVDES